MDAGRPQSKSGLIVRHLGGRIGVTLLVNGWGCRPYCCREAIASSQISTDSSRGSRAHNVRLRGTLFVLIIWEWYIQYAAS